MPIRRRWSRKPYKLLLRMRPRRHHLQDSWIHRILGDRLFEAYLWIPNRKSAAMAASIGIFMGFIPLIGLQFLITILLSYFLRANITIAALCTFICNPFTTGAIILLEIKIGEALIAGQIVKAPPHMGISQYFSLYGKDLLVGSLACAVIGSIIAYPITLWIWKLGENTSLKRRRKSFA